MAAGVWIRARAFLWDYLWISLYLVLLAVVTVFVIPDIQGLFQGSLAVAQLAGFLLVTVPVSLYFAVFDSKHFNGTFGKRKMAIQVIGRNGKAVGLMRSAVRTSLKFTPWELSHFLVYRLAGNGAESVSLILILVGASIYGLLFLYVLSVFLSKDKRALYDWLSGTKVIRKE
ncbi:RDD family protein [Planococcus maritimus]|uniref:RDD family protein n=1 Tax=Planococcus maritimus TaxID=192421 RepID=UPI003138B391